MICPTCKATLTGHYATCKTLKNTKEKKSEFRPYEVLHSCGCHFKGMKHYDSGRLEGEWTECKMHREGYDG